VDREIPGDRLLRQGDLSLRLRDPFEDLRVALRQLADPHPILHLRHQVQEPEQVADGRAVQAQSFGEVILFKPEPFQVVLEPLRLLDGVQVAPLDVLDQGGLEHLLVVEVDDVDGDGFEAGALGGAEAAFPGDQLIPVAVGADDERLQHAVLANAGAEAREFVLVERLAGLMRVLADAVDRDPRRVGRRGAVVAADQGVQPAAEAGFGGHRQPPCWGTKGALPRGTIRSRDRRGNPGSRRGRPCHVEPV
jgi:hypothetical protein